MISMNTEQFRQYALEGDAPILVEFWAPWCGYCRRIAPALGRVAEQLKGTLAVGQVNIDDEPALADEERIEVVPTLILYHGGKALGSIVAPESKAGIEEFIRQTLG